MRQDIKRTNHERKITDKLDFVTIKNFCPSKESADKPQIGKNYLQNTCLIKYSYSEYIINKLINKKISNLIFLKGQKTQTGTLQKTICKWPLKT